MRMAFMDEQDVIPEKATVTVAKTNDRTQMNDGEANGIYALEYPYE